MMRNLYLTIMLLCSLASFGQGIYDGPYVSYEEGKVWIRSIANGTVIKTELKDKKVRVNFADPVLNFSVSLKKSLQNEPAVFAQPSKMFVVSDIEGQFVGFRNLLLANKVIDEQYNWTYGKGHLIICGDLFDRGLSVTETIWFIYKLEELAKKAGGYVHTILGNHDIMNLSGDLRYVQPKYMESAKLMEVDYMTLYDKNSELGRWLRTKNTIEKIGDNLCMHAGVSPIINELGHSVAQINTLCRPFYDQVKQLQGVGDPKIDPFFKGKSSLFWYRGYFFEPKATEVEVTKTLDIFNVKRVIVGHTIVKGNVAFYYGGKVLGIDVNRHGGDHQAAVFENGEWFAVNEKAERRKIVFND
ncbi:metallophosphoesterase [Pedobacter ureilyticus]|uniref:Metallophosphoesterase n=1 Tax=Pedobacter ureilyticus TaxID=1393051 RepID=A0ABW9J8W0_9SPHI|nr:metallophosphoesterase [Pedobacter helvus]